MKRLKECVLIAACIDLLLFCMVLFQNNIAENVWSAMKQDKEAINVVNTISSDAMPMEKGKIAITFDDGPHPKYTKELLDGLKERNVVATFFVTGSNSEKYPELIKRMEDEGHLVGNHTYSHIQLTNGNETKFKEELIKTNQTICDIIGHGTDFVRPPYGTWNKQFEEELNMFPVLWNVDPRDWEKTSVVDIVNSTIPKVKENDIILMHDSFPSSVKAALEIIDILKEEGYEFVTVDHILFD